MSPTLRLPLARLSRTPRSIISIGGAALLAIAAAIVARGQTSDHTADRALLGTYATIALPLLVYAVVGAALGGRGMGSASRALVSLGATPARAARDTLLVSAGASALLGGALAALVSAVAHSAGDPPLVGDVIASLWIGALGGGAYAAFFTLGSTVGKMAMVRGLLLAADWILGSGIGFGALLTPRAHIRNLFGGAAPADVSQRASMLALVIVGVGFGALAIFRSRRAR